MTAALDVTEGLIDAPGVYNLPEQQYHADPLRHLGGSLSSTVARHLLPPSCPALARWEADHPQHKDAWDLGSVTHRLVLGSGCPIVEVPAATWTAAGGAGKKARAQARGAGAVALLTKDLDAARAMRDAVHADPLAHSLLTLPGRPEQTLAWQEDVDGDPIWCRAMFDRWPDPRDWATAITDGGTADPPAAVDLKKTAKPLSDAALSKTIYDYGYHQQEDFYRRGYRAVHGVWPDFFFIFVSDTDPHLVRVVELDDEFRRLGREANDLALRVWRDCLASGAWPSYPPVGDIALIGPPRWARTREDYY